MTLSIVHVLAPARFGGLESVVHTLATGQASSGHAVTVIGGFTEEPGDHAFWSRIRATSGVRAVPVVVGAREYLKERKAVGQVLDEVGADVLHTHGYRPDILLPSVGRVAGVATVTTVHGFTGNGWRNRLYEWLQRRSFRAFDAVVAVSAPLRRELLASGVPNRVLHCLPNAWAPTGAPLSRSEARAALGLDEAAPVVGWIGRMSPEKAPDLALDAFELLAKDNPSARLSFIGDGRLRTELESRAEREGLGDRVHWHGVIPDAGRYLTAFDALLISSWTEGTPIVLLEAMAAAVPIVTTAVGGIPDVVSDKEAVLVDAGDVDGMARALGPILAGAPVAASRAEAAQARLRDEFAVSPWVERYAHIYESCITERTCSQSR